MGIMLVVVSFSVNFLEVTNHIAILFFGCGNSITKCKFSIFVRSKLYR
jgi:hypothetical protein